MSVITDLLKVPFCRRDISSKNEIIKTMRPTPKINLSQKIKNKKQECLRHFQSSIYDKFKWMCGCSDKNKLFCWPCLLFVTNVRDKNIWVLQGYDDLTHLHEAGRKHEKAQTHINSVILLKTFDTVRKDLLLDKERALNIVQHNENVSRNRNILKRLIEVVCYLAKQKSAFRCHDESNSLLNCGNYTELLNLISKYDEVLANHLHTSSIFSGTSNWIQNDIMESIKNVITLEIRNEIKNTPFVAIMLHETSDISHKSQLSVVFRFVLPTGLPVERFLFLTDVSADRSANAFCTIIKDTVSNWGCEDKLITQTYDGAAVMAGELEETQEKVRGIYPEAMFVHCCAHVLNLVLSQSVTYIKECKIFFAAISGIASFLSVSIKRNFALSENVKKKFPKIAAIRWNSSCLVNTIKNERIAIYNFFENITENPENWDNETINMSKGFCNFFEDFNSQFLLTFFSEIFKYTNELFDILQKNTFDITYCIQKVDEVKSVLQDMRKPENFDKVYNDVVSIVGTPQIKKKRLNAQNSEQHFQQLYNEILDTLCNQIEIRFEKLNSLKFFELLNLKFYDKYENKFPDECLNSLMKNYSKFFDFVKLTNELSVIYRSESFCNLDISGIIKYIQEHDLTDALNEVYKLAQLILTIPFSTASVERSFSALKRINSYSRNSSGQERLNSLSLIYIEKELLTYLQSKPDFVDKVIDSFGLMSDISVDLTYK